MSNPRPRKEDYEPVDAGSVPELTWKPAGGPQAKAYTILYSIGNLYKLVRQRDTGAVAYFKRKDLDEKKSSAESIDAEPQKKGQVRYREGSHAWFIVDGRWFCVTVVKRDGLKSITIKSVTGWDAERLTAWPYPEELEFPAYPNSTLFQQLRPLKARQT